MKLCRYTNTRTGHTFAVEHRGRYVIQERDWLGERFYTLAEYDTEDKAQDMLDRIADSMGWYYTGESKHGQKI